MDKDKYKKPPLGVIPPRFVKSYAERFYDIEEAIMRYRKVGKEVPAAWYEEQLLITRINGL